MNDPADELLDARLRAAFAPPPAAHFDAMARAAIGAPVRVRRWPWLLAAAALLLGIGLLVARPVRGPEGHDGAQLGAMWAAAFEHAAQNGFGDGSCCDQGSDANALCQEKFAVRLAIGNGIALRGCYCGLPTGGCIAVLAQTSDGPTGVFIVPRAQDPQPCLPPGCRLQLARRELGPMVLYAIARTAPAHSLQEFALAP